MHFKNNIKQGLFRIQGLRSFKDTLPKNLKKIINKKGYIYSDLLNKWSYLVGKKISDISYPKSYKPNGNNSSGTLIILIERGYEVEIEYSKKLIINKINSYFGYNIISKIRLETFENKKTNKKKFLVSNKSKNKYLESIKKIKNEKIKKSLINLTKSISL